MTWRAVLFVALLRAMALTTLLAAVGCGESGEHPLGSSVLFTQLSGGGDHTCGVSSSQSLLCWGADGWAQSTPPTQGVFHQVSAGAAHTCAVDEDGALVCFGLSDHEQATPPPGAFTAVDAGRLTTCALDIDGQLTCFGCREEDVVFEDNTPTCADRDVRTLDGPFADVSVGRWHHTCTLDVNGDVVCHGGDDFGETAVPSSWTDVQKVVAGWANTCALLADGSIDCVGRDSYGESSPPSGTFVDFDLGTTHGCAVDVDGAVQCWGSNDSGQLDVVADQTYTAIIVGDRHSCGLTQFRRAVCWGRDTQDQLGVP